MILSDMGTIESFGEAVGLKLKITVVLQSEGKVCLISR